MLIADLCAAQCAYFFHTEAAYTHSLKLLYSQPLLLQDWHTTLSADQQSCLLPRPLLIGSETRQSRLTAAKRFSVAVLSLSADSTESACLLTVSLCHCCGRHLKALF